MTAKEEVHQLVDSLAETDLHAARRFLEFLRSTRDDPFLSLLAEAPEDDEPTDLGEDRSVQEAWEEYRRGEARPWESVREELAGG